VSEPPKVIYLQFYDDEKPDVDTISPGDVTWCADKINDSDIRYVIDKRHLRRIRKDTNER
jgi:hypothetical protein